MSSHLYLVRHAPTAYNARGMFMGGLDVAAEPVVDPDRFRVPCGGQRVIYASPLRRALTAASVLFPGEHVTQDARLVERSMGELEGLDHATVKSRWPDSFVGSSVNPRFAPPGGETMQVFAARVADFLLELMTHTSGDQDAYVVTHNGWIRTALLLRGQVEPDELFSESVAFLEPIAYACDADRLRRREGISGLV